MVHQHDNLYLILINLKPWLLVVQKVHQLIYHKLLRRVGQQNVEGKQTYTIWF
jgi:hypothetical protein